MEGLRLLHELGYSEFKLLSQFHFLPVAFPSTNQQSRYETALRLLNGRNVFVRAACKFGMRRLLDREIARSRTQSGWSFPSGNSGPLSDETKGSWQTYSQILHTFARAEEARRRGDSSIFWRSAEPWAFWADFRAHHAG
jgi:hypothetical protein